MKIVLDYGHCLSGADTGASGNGYREENCTREIGKKVKAKLESLGHIVVEVAPDYATTVSESLRLRVNRANSAGADLSVSIHLNAGGGRGTEIYTKNGSGFTQANNVLSELVKLGYVNRGIKDGSELALVGGVYIQSMLIECCFIDTEDMYMYNPENISSAITRGLVGSGGIIPPVPPIPDGKKKYLNLNPSAVSWRVYPTNKQPVIGNEVGTLAPAKYGGLSYEIMNNPSVDVYTIRTETFGVVNIYAPKNDPQCSFTSSAVYGGGTTAPSGVKFLNLSPAVTAWRVYPTYKSPVIGNEVGSLAPSQYGGLSYQIKNNPQKDVYTITTETFGTVNIYAPRDTDSSITTYAVY